MKKILIVILIIISCNNSIDKVEVNDIILNTGFLYKTSLIKGERIVNNVYKNPDTILFKLTQEEIQSIQKKYNELDLYSFPDSIFISTKCSTSPILFSKVQVQLKNRIQTFAYTECFVESDKVKNPKYLRVWKFIVYINDIIYENKEIDKMPLSDIILL